MGPPTLVSGQTVANQLVSVSPFMGRLGECPTPRCEPEEFETGGCRHGWQCEVAMRVERQHGARTERSHGVEYTFIQNRFHPMTLSSKQDFIQ